MAAMAAKPAPKKSMDAPKKQLSLGPAYDKTGWEAVVETFGCGTTVSEDDIKEMKGDMQDIKNLLAELVGNNGVMKTEE